jgi:hypothetical protein
MRTRGSSGWMLFLVACMAAVLGVQAFTAPTFTIAATNVTMPSGGQFGQQSIHSHFGQRLRGSVAWGLYVFGQCDGSQGTDVRNLRQSCFHAGSESDGHRQPDVDTLWEDDSFRRRSLYR